MEVDRSTLLAAISEVKPAVDTKGGLPQSDCLIFKGGQIYTLCAEMACSIPSPLDDITGAINAELLVAGINKVAVDKLEITATESELVLKSGRRKAGIAFHQEINLPVETIDSPDEWEELDDSFRRVLSMAVGCCGVDLPRFVLNCIYLNGSHVESADPYQIFRSKIPLTFDSPILVSGKTIRNVLDAVAIGQTDDWLHFRKASGAVVSCRKYLDEFPDVGQFFETEGDPLKLPHELGEIANRAAAFSERGKEDFVQVFVSLKDGTMLVEGRSAAAWYKESVDIEYLGPKLRFLIDPKLLSQLVKLGDTCKVSKERLLIESGDFQYVTCLGVTE